MTANVQFLVSEKEDVLTIPNMALRFKPPEEKDESAGTCCARSKAERRRRESALGGQAAAAAVATSAGEARQGRRVKIYLLKDGKAQPVEVQVGITDGSKSEVIDSALKENDPIIIGLSSSANQGQAGSGQSVPAGAAAPRFPMSELIRVEDVA